MMWTAHPMMPKLTSGPTTEYLHVDDKSWVNCVGYVCFYSKTNRPNQVQAAAFNRTTGKEEQRWFSLEDWETAKAWALAVYAMQ